MEISMAFVALAALAAGMLNPTPLPASEIVRAERKMFKKKIDLSTFRERNCFKTVIFFKKVGLRRGERCLRRGIVN